MTEVLFFYENFNSKCDTVREMLKELQVPVIPCDVYKEQNLSLVEKWGVFCVPTLVFFPSLNIYKAEQITEDKIKNEIELEL